MRPEERVEKYKWWALLSSEYPDVYRIYHDVTDDSFTPILQRRDPATTFWLTLERMDSWRFDLEN